MRLPWVAISLVAIIACATYSQFMIHPSGQTAICQAHGSGLLGSEQARRIQERCQASFRAAGYVEIERAGVIGIMVSDSLRVVRVVPGSPADSVGIVAGDRVANIDGQLVEDRAMLQLLLFGEPGQPITLHLVRGSDSVEVTAIRKPYPAIYGRTIPP